MFGDDGRGLLFVGFHRIGHRGIVIDHRDRDAAFDKLRKVVVVGQTERRPHDQAIDPPIEQPADLFFPLDVALFEVGYPIEVSGPDRIGR
jgi:hypothetical protein